MAVAADGLFGVMVNFFLMLFHLNPPLGQPQLWELAQGEPAGSLCRRVLTGAVHL